MQAAFMLLIWLAIQIALFRPLAPRQRKIVVVISIVLVTLMALLIVATEKDAEKAGGAAALLCLGGFPLVLTAATFVMLFHSYVVAPVWRVTVGCPTAAPQPHRVNREQVQAEQQRLQASDLAYCEELRLECELLYSRHAEQLRSVLPPEQFRALLDSYLSGLSDPEQVRKRTDMIKKMVTDHLTAAETSGKAGFESLQELAEHFAALRREAQELPYDEGTRDSILTALNKQEDESIEAFFRQ